MRRGSNGPGPFILEEISLFDSWDAVDKGKKVDEKSIYLFEHQDFDTGEFREWCRYVISFLMLFRIYKKIALLFFMNFL